MKQITLTKFYFGKMIYSWKKKKNRNIWYQNTQYIAILWWKSYCDLRVLIKSYRGVSGNSYFNTQQAAFVLYLLAVEVGVSSEWASGASEGEHGEGDGDGHVHANLCKVHTHIIQNYIQLLPRVQIHPGV